MERDLKATDVQDNLIRLNKAIAMRGYCSRRKADELIKNGQIKINGMVETNPGRRINPEDKIEINGKKLNKANELIYVLINKPVGYICTLSDPQNRQTVNSLLPPSLQKSRPSPAGRLDYFSEGLLLLTNDGHAIQQLCHPRHHQPKSYEVIIRAVPTAFQLKKIREGLTLSDGIELAPIEINATALPDGNTKLIMTLHQGINRQIRRICADFGWVILKLKRISQGSLQLGSLKPGEWRKLTQKEINALYDSFSNYSKI